MDNNISPEEKLFRNVITNPNFWKTAEGRPTSALFKDSKGVSVDRDGKRTKVDIISSFKKRFQGNIKAIIFVDASYCDELETVVVHSPEEDNEYHALILDSHDKIEIHKKKATKLAQNSSIVYLDGQII